jgi:hypothetical protein
VTAEASEQVDTSFRQNIMTGWGLLNESLFEFRGCTGCHFGTIPSGGMRLDQDTATIYDVLVPLRTGGSPPLVLCKPLNGSCGTHGQDVWDPNNDGNLSDDPGYLMLQRWINDGAPNN